jgi:predicted Zn-dependent protease
VLVFLTACSSEPAAPIVRDACAPLALVGDDASIAAAEALWNAVGIASIGEAGGDALPVIFTSHAAPDEFGAYAGAAIYVADAVEGDARTIVLAHEIGHAIGLVHVSDRPSVMNPGNTTIAPSSADDAAVIALWGSCVDATVHDP